MKEQRLYFTYLYKLIAILITLGLILLLVTNKGGVVLWINRHHLLVLDQFFSIITHLGDGIIFLVVTLLFLFVKFKNALITLFVGILHSLIIVLFKHVLFSDVVRPRNFFGPEIDLHFIPWVTVHGHMSFPSGHTATIFALALLLALIAKKKLLTVLFFTIATLVGISRIYILQHFFVDVYVGMFIGLASTGVIWYSMKYFKAPKWFASKLIVNIKVSKHKTGSISEAGT